MTLSTISTNSYESQSLAERVRGRQSEYEGRRNLTDAQRDAIVEVCRPDLVAGLVGPKTEGAFEGSEIVEGTAVHALQIWARGFRVGMMSRRPGREWFREVVRDPPRWTGVQFTGNDEVNRYCQDLAEVLQADMRRSNLYDVIGAVLLDGGSVGSPVMTFQQDLARDRLICRVPDYASVWLDKDVFGHDNCLHVLHELTALQAAEFFGPEQLPDAVRLQLRSGRHYEKTKYLQAIYGSGDPIYDGVELAKARPWLEHFIVYQTTGADAKKLLKPKRYGPGYFTRPFASWHYHRNEHEVYGRTMAWWAIYDIRGLNGMWESLFAEAELSIRPVTWAMDALRGMLDLAPGGQNWARNESEYNMPPQYLDRHTRYQPGIDFTERLIQGVQRHFHYSFFMSMNQIVMQKTQPETAYALSRVQAENGIQLIEQVESYEQQVLGVIHDVFFDARRRAQPAYDWGELPKPPDILLEYSQDAEVSVEFVGPLSLTEINDVAIDRFYRVMGPARAVFEVAPETVHKFRWSQILEQLAEAQNFKQDHIVSEDDYQAILQGLQQRAIQQEIAEAAPKMTKAVKNLESSVEKDSPLAALAGGKR
ncbi:MAG: portal protein [Planctomycetota bacterium]